MPNIIIVAQQNEETVQLCSELNQYGFKCLMMNNDNAFEQVGTKTASLLLIEYSDSPDTEAICRYFHLEKGLPIIAVTAQEKIDSLNRYIDDFVIKPFDTRELVIRAKRLIKKVEDVSKERIIAGGIIIDPDKFEVYADGKLVSLTFKEYELLKFLASNPGRVFTRDNLLNQVWSEDYFGGDRTVDVHIRRLRSKIEDPSHIYIETVRNIGYRFINS